MTFNVRIALWFPLVIGGFLSVFGAIRTVSGHGTWDLADLFEALPGLLGVAVALLLRDFPLVTITPERVRSYTGMLFHSVALRPDDRLTVWDDRLWVVHANGYSSEIPVYRILLRDADWQRLHAEVARRWAPPHHTAG